MVSPEKIEQILLNLGQYLAKLRVLAAIPKNEFLSDFTKIESAKHLLQVAIECCLDAGNHIISSENYKSPRNYNEIMEILVSHLILPKELSPRIRQMVQFRNRLVHLYWEIDEQTLYEILQRNLDDFELFSKAILAFSRK